MNKLDSKAENEVLYHGTYSALSGHGRLAIGSPITTNQINQLILEFIESKKITQDSKKLETVDQQSKSKLQSTAVDSTGQVFSMGNNNNMKYNKKKVYKALKVRKVTNFLPTTTVTTVQTTKHIIIKNLATSIINFNNKTSIQKTKKSMIKLKIKKNENAQTDFKQSPAKSTSVSAKVKKKSSPISISLLELIKNNYKISKVNKNDLPSTDRFVQTNSDSKHSTVYSNIQVRRVTVMH
jgi:hypothetical protein